MKRSRTVLVGLTLGIVATYLLIQVQAQPPEQPGEINYPVSGKMGPGLEPLEKAVINIMHRHGIPGAALAVAREGKLLMMRGYGWSNLATDEKVRPDTLFGLASLSKSITAVAIFKLIEQGKLQLDDRAFEILDHLKLPPNQLPDPRLKTITIRQLLNHSAGWDAAKSGDPVSWSTRINGKRGPNLITAQEMIRYVMTLRLDFDPGTEMHYSNFGFVVLGEVIARQSGQTYQDYVLKNVLIPAGVRRASLHPLGGLYFENESRRYLAGMDTELPAWQQKQADACGGWVASAQDLIHFLTALDGSRGKPLLQPKTFAMMLEPPLPPLKPRENGSYMGLGWDTVAKKDRMFGYFKDGLWYGMRTYMKRSPLGINWVLLFNASVQNDPTDQQLLVDAIKDIREQFDRQEKYPDIDLFEEF